jgi:hypothetical protein
MFFYVFINIPGTGVMSMIFEGQNYKICVPSVIAVEISN